jgi:hypothetical protein
VTKLRAIAIAGVLIVIGIVLAARRCGSSVEPPADASREIVITKARLKLRDLARQPVGSLGGAVTVDGKPGDGAIVCAQFADDDRDDAPRCLVVTGGRYQFLDLKPGGYLVWASYPSYAGVRWRDRDGNERVALAAGKSRSDLDFAIVQRGAEVSGRVRDTRGGAVAEALVHVRVEGDKAPSFTARTSADGTFRARVAASAAIVEATAEGYVDERVETTVPATGVEITMLPAATLAGIVIETGTRAPIADARVWVDGSQVMTGDDGTFRATKLRPGRYKPTASAIGGYGEAAESVLLRVGATVDNVVIELHPVTVVAARIVVEGTTKGCPEGDGNVTLERRGSRDYNIGRTTGDGDVLLEGVVPGSYAVRLHCVGYLAAGSYPDLVVGNTDVEDVVWPVTPGAKVSGRVIAKDGGPIAGAVVTVSAGFTGGRVSTAADGTYVVGGVSPGEVTVSAAQTGYLPSPDRKVQATLAGATGIDLVLDKAGGIEGTVLDRAGQPVAGVRITAREGSSIYGPHTTSGLRGEFSFLGLEPGTYTMVVESKWQLPEGSRLMGKPVRAVVTREGTARVQLEIEPETGSVTGIVVGADGAPLADVAIDVALTAADVEPRKRDWELDLAWTSATGEFTVTGIPDHLLAIRARVAGANEIVADGVKLGERVRLVLKPTGTIAGVVLDPGGAPVDDVALEIEDRAQNISRRERLFYTGGRFSFRELPAGSYRITADEDRQTSVTIELADGARRTDLQLQLRPRHAIKGRLVSADRRPLANYKLEVPHKESMEKTANGRFVVTYESEQAVTDARGEFLIEGLVGAEVTISAGDLATGGDPSMTEVKTVPLVGPPIIDLGDVLFTPKP